MNASILILSALIPGLLLAWAISHLVAIRYTTEVLAFMQTPVDSQTQDRISFQDNNSKKNTHITDFRQQNQYAFQRLSVFIICISLSIALLLALLQSEFLTNNFSFRTFVLTGLVKFWLVIPSLGILQRWSRGKIIGRSIVYIMISGIIDLAFTVGLQTHWGTLFWGFGSGTIELIILVFFLTNLRIRTIFIYLFITFFVLTICSLIGLRYVHYLTFESSSLLERMLAMILDRKFLFLLFGLMPWLLAFFPLRWLAKKLIEAYNKKLFSDVLFLIMGFWAFFIIFETIRLSYPIGILAYTLVAVIPLVPYAFLLFRPFLSEATVPPTLLLLRVFRSDKEIEHLYDDVIDRWRYSGNTLMIAGKDLALRNLEPDELFAFLSGQLQQRFISGLVPLRESIQQLDLIPDPDGRYRINEFFCLDNTWKMVVQTLVSKTDLVLMDLRAYSSEREGCTHELNVLASSTHLRKLVILYDNHTDKAVAEQLLVNSRLPVVWINSDSGNNTLKQQVLDALLMV